MAWKQRRGYGFSYIYREFRSQIGRKLYTREFMNYCGERVTRLFRRSARAEKSSERPNPYTAIASSIKYFLRGRRVVIWATDKRAAIKQFGKDEVVAGTGPYSTDTSKHRSGKAKALPLPTMYANGKRTYQFGKLAFKGPKGGMANATNYVGSLHEIVGYVGKRPVAGRRLFSLWRSMGKFYPHRNLRHGGSGWAPTYAEITEEMRRSAEMFARNRM